MARGRGGRGAGKVKSITEVELSYSKTSKKRSRENRADILRTKLINSPRAEQVELETGEGAWRVGERASGGKMK